MKGNEKQGKAGAKRSQSKTPASDGLSKKLPDDDESIHPIDQLSNPDDAITSGEDEFVGSFMDSFKQSAMQSLNPVKDQILKKIGKELGIPANAMLPRGRLGDNRKHPTLLTTKAPPKLSKDVVERLKKNDEEREKRLMAERARNNRIIMDDEPLRGGHFGTDDKHPDPLNGRPNSLNKNYTSIFSLTDSPKVDMNPKVVDKICDDFAGRSLQCFLACVEERRKMFMNSDVISTLAGIHTDASREPCLMIVVAQQPIVKMHNTYKLLLAGYALVCKIMAKNDSNRLSVPLWKAFARNQPHLDTILSQLQLYNDRMAHASQCQRTLSEEPYPDGYVFRDRGCTNDPLQWDLDDESLSLRAITFNRNERCGYVSDADDILQYVETFIDPLVDVLRNTARVCDALSDEDGSSAFVPPTKRARRTQPSSPVARVSSPPSAMIPSSKDWDGADSGAGPSGNLSPVYDVDNEGFVPKPLGGRQKKQRGISHLHDREFKRSGRKGKADAWRAARKVVIKMRDSKRNGDSMDCYSCTMSEAEQREREAEQAMNDAGGFSSTSAGSDSDVTLGSGVHAGSDAEAEGVDKSPEDPGTSTKVPACKPPPRKAKNNLDLKSKLAAWGDAVEEEVDAVTFFDNAKKMFLKSSSKNTDGAPKSRPQLASILSPLNQPEAKEYCQKLDRWFNTLASLHHKFTTDPEFKFVDQKDVDSLADMFPQDVNARSFHQAVKIFLGYDWIDPAPASLKVTPTCFTPGEMQNIIKSCKLEKGKIHAAPEDIKFSWGGVFYDIKRDQPIPKMFPTGWSFVVDKQDGLIPPADKQRSEPAPEDKRSAKLRYHHLYQRWNQKNDVWRFLCFGWQCLAKHVVCYRDNDPSLNLLHVGHSEPFNDNPDDFFDPGAEALTGIFKQECPVLQKHRLSPWIKPWDKIVVSWSEEVGYGLYIEIQKKKCEDFLDQVLIPRTAYIANMAGLIVSTSSPNDGYATCLYDPKSDTRNPGKSPFASITPAPLGRGAKADDRTNAGVGSEGFYSNATCNAKNPYFVQICTSGIGLYRELYHRSKWGNLCDNVYHHKPDGSTEVAYSPLRCIQAARNLTGQDLLNIGIDQGDGTIRVPVEWPYYSDDCVTSDDAARIQQISEEQTAQAEQVARDGKRISDGREWKNCQCQTICSGRMCTGWVKFPSYIGWSPSVGYNETNRRYNGDNRKRAPANGKGSAVSRARNTVPSDNGKGKGSAVSRARIAVPSDKKEVPAPANAKGKDPAVCREDDPDLSDFRVKDVASFKKKRELASVDISGVMGDAEFSSDDLDAGEGSVRRRKRKLSSVQEIDQPSSSNSADTSDKPSSSSADASLPVGTAELDDRLARPVAVVPSNSVGKPKRVIYPNLLSNQCLSLSPEPEEKVRTRSSSKDREPAPIVTRKKQTVRKGDFVDLT